MVEGRDLTKGNLLKFGRCRTLRRRLDMENTKRAQKEKSGIRPSGETYVEPKDLLSGLERVREAARRDSQIQFTSLFHHITVGLLRESYRKLNSKAAPGVDDVTWTEYGNGLESRLADLHDRVTMAATEPNPPRGLTYQRAMVNNVRLVLPHWKTR